MRDQAYSKAVAPISQLKTYSEIDYDGEINEDGKICGRGLATTGSGTIFSGFWFDGIEHGVCK